VSNEAGAPPPPGGGGAGGGDRRRRRRRRGGRGPRPEGQEQQQGPEEQRPQQQRPKQQRPQQQRQQRPQQQQQQQQRQQQRSQGQERPQQAQQPRPRREDRPPREDRPQRPQQPQQPQQEDRPRPQAATPPAAAANDFDAAWTDDAAVAAPEPAEVEVQRTPTPPLPVEPRDPDGEDVFRPDDPDVAWPAGQLVNLTGVKFRDAGTIYEFDAGDASYRRGDKVVVETERGPALGTVAVGSRRASSVEPLRRIARPANSGDERQRERNALKEREALVFCKQKIRERKMPMKLARVEYPLSPSGGRVLFYFASEERIDFRDLVKDLAQKLHARIEMRQIGARDEAKAVGGIGSCGRELCCSTWLPAFVPISIKMAKDQGLVLNPSKLAGQCGRLKCCLVYEHSTYKEMSKTLPKMGKRVTTPAGDGKVVELDVLRQKVRVWFEEGGSQTFPGDVVKQILPPGAQKPEPEPDPEPEQTE
jgi:cell fate regulator YaaT (PSP1 superfamily)